MELVQHLHLQPKHSYCINFHTSFFYPPNSCLLFSPQFFSFKLNKLIISALKLFIPNCNSNTIVMFSYFCLHTWGFQKVMLGRGWILQTLLTERAMKSARAWLEFSAQEQEVECAASLDFCWSRCFDALISQRRSGRVDMNVEDRRRAETSGTVSDDTNSDV